MAENFHEVSIDFQKNGPFRLEQSEKKGIISSHIYLNNNLVKNFDQLAGNGQEIEEKVMSDLPLANDISLAHQYIADELMHHYPEYIDMDNYYHSKENFERDVPINVINDHMNDLIQETLEEEREFEITEDEYVAKLEEYAKECEMYGIAQTEYAQAEVDLKQYENELYQLEQDEKIFQRDEKEFTSRKKPAFYKFKARKEYYTSKHSLEERKQALMERRKELVSVAERAAQVVNSVANQEKNISSAPAKPEKINCKENNYIDKLEAYIENVKDFTINKLENIRGYSSYIDAVKEVHAARKVVKEPQKLEETLDKAQLSVETNVVDNIPLEYKREENSNQVKNDTVVDKDMADNEAALKAWKVKLDECKQNLEGKRLQLDKQKNELSIMKNKILEQRRDREKSPQHKTCHIKKELNNLEKSAGADHKIRVIGLDDKNLADKVTKALISHQEEQKVEAIRKFQAPNVKIINIEDSYRLEAKKVLGNNKWSKDTNVQVAKKLLLNGFDKEKVEKAIAKFSPIKVNSQHAKNIVNMVCKQPEVAKQFGKTLER